MKRTIKLFVMAVLLMAGGRVFAQDTHEYVDLGLPSGTLWATCNVGATTPEGYGDHFAWGETAPQAYTDEAWRWYTYKHCKGAENRLTKYCKSSSDGYQGYTDNQSVLLPEDDAATVNWGSEWRMPTLEDWKELKENTTVQNFTLNGVWGFRYIGPNGKSIFLPAAGKNKGFGWIGIYWSSTLLMKSSTEAYGFWHNGMTNMERATGCSVRPVRAAK